ncbi:hypothetical protein KA050_03880 [Candidatus Gracilibacteria bacterium]|nr:hypothetical protein [Candidatus Gracilibacteria bacterium]
MLAQTQENYKKTQDDQTGGDEALEAGDYQKAQELYNSAAEGISHQNKEIKEKIGESSQLAEDTVAQAELGKEVAGGIRTTAIVVGATVAIPLSGGASLAALGNAVAIGTTAGAIGQIYEQGGEVIFNNKDGAEAFIDGAKGTGQAAFDSALAGTGMMSGLKVAGMAGKGMLSTGAIAGGVNTATQSATRTGLDVSQKTATFFVENGDKIKDLSASEVANVYAEHMAAQGLAPDQIAKNFAFDVTTGALGGGVGAKFGPLQEAAKGAMKHLGMHAGEVGSDAALAVLSAHARSYMNTGKWDASPEDIQKELINTLTGSLTGKYAAVRQTSSQGKVSISEPSANSNEQTRLLQHDRNSGEIAVGEKVMSKDSSPTTTERVIGLEGGSLKDEVSGLKGITDSVQKKEKIQQIRDMVQKDRDISVKAISLIEESLQKCVDQNIGVHKWRENVDTQSQIETLLEGCSAEAKQAINARIEEFQKSRDYQAGEINKGNIHDIVESYFGDSRLGDYVAEIEQGPYGMNFIVDPRSMEGFYSKDVTQVGLESEALGFASKKTREDESSNLITDRDTLLVVEKPDQIGSTRDHEDEHMRNQHIRGRNFFPKKEASVSNEDIITNPTASKKGLIEDHKKQVNDAVICAQDEVFSYLVNTQKYADHSPNQVKKYLKKEYKDQYLGEYEFDYKSATRLFSSDSDRGEVSLSQKQMLERYDILVDNMVDFSNAYIEQNGGYNRELVDRLRITPMTDWPSLMPGSRWQRGDFIL